LLVSQGGTQRQRGAGVKGIVAAPDQLTFFARNEPGIIGVGSGEPSARILEVDRVHRPNTRITGAIHMNADAAVENIGSVGGGAGGGAARGAGDLQVAQIDDAGIGASVGKGDAEGDRFQVAAGDRQTLDRLDGAVAGVKGFDDADEQILQGAAGDSLPDN